eukprot:CAMPEP_0185796680 /NCGR_PEP_ID=MMETSP1174-20130828/161216_1 /TAXON_ID=35687 /ORGANISM="Dictyocha speculum, Strain CCMP1381" /LENGTH=70 /DNA_ID=CAMNT_0028492071 /DNA_START=452 /DNA_END=664 /DNA_ORIENTATION=+
MLLTQVPSLGWTTTGLAGVIVSVGGASPPAHRRMHERRRLAEPTRLYQKDFGLRSEKWRSARAKEAKEAA